jgi:hypothetical protein
LDSQLYGRGDFAVEFQSDKWNPADFPEVRFEEVWWHSTRGDRSRVTRISSVLDFLTFLVTYRDRDMEWEAIILAK